MFPFSSCKNPSVRILLIGQNHDVHFARRWEAGPDAGDISLSRFLADCEPKINRKLRHFESLIEQEFPKFRRRLALGPRSNRQIEHDIQPHKAVSAKLGSRRRRHFAQTQAGFLLAATPDFEFPSLGSEPVKASTAPYKRTLAFLPARSPCPL